MEHSMLVGDILGGSMHVADETLSVKNIRWNGQQQTLATVLLDTQLLNIVNRLLLLDDLHRHEDDLRRQKQQLSPREGPNENKSLAQSQQSSSSTKNDGSPMELERLKQMKQSLILLRTGLQNVCEIVDSSGPSQQAIQKEHETRIHAKLANQINGIAIPLLNALQRGGGDRACSEPIIFVSRSATYANMEEAALSLIVLWRFVPRIVDATSTSSSCEEKNSFIKSLALPILVSSTMALSSMEVKRDKSDDDGNVDAAEDSEEKKTSRDAEAFDTGEDFAMAVLRLIQAIFKPNNHHTKESENHVWEFATVAIEKQHDTTSFSSSLSNEVGSAMGGSLLARLVLVCLSLLRQKKIVTGRSNPTRVRQKENSAILQLKSLETLSVLMESISLTESWKSILPGCFARLYQSAFENLRYTSAASTYKVASESVFALSLLLKQSLFLPVAAIGGNEKSSQSVLSSLMRMVDQARQTSEANDVKESAAQSPHSDKEENPFQNEVNTRLPGPLSILLGMIPANQSRLVRKSGLSLCRVVLVDTMHIWHENIKESLGRKAFEYCLMLLSDDNAELQQCSRQLLRSYRSFVGEESWRRRLSKSIVPTILELVEMLPVLAKNGKDLEVCNYLRLINGYISVSFKNLECDEQKQQGKKRKSDIGVALSCPQAIDTIRQSFAVLFTPDVNSINVRPMIEIGMSSEPSLIITRRENRSFRFLHIKIVEMARRTVRLLACALGAKRSAFLIDVCFADVFQSCVKYVGQNDHNPIAYGVTPQLDWCGSCLFASEILAGIEGPINGATKDLHIITSLASSVLPVVVSHPLWTLPTSTNESEASKSASMVSMRSNAALVCSLMMFMNQLFSSLGEDMRLNLPIIILPLLERVSAIGNHSAVQTCAFETLLDLALSIGYSDIFSLLTANFDYIMEHISQKLQRHSKERTPVSRSLVGVVTVVLQIVVRDNKVDQAYVPTVCRLLDCILKYSDRVSDPKVSYILAFDTICVLRSINSFMESSIGAQNLSVGPGSAKLEDQQHEPDWLQRLDTELEMNSAGCFDDDDKSPFIEQDDCDAVESHEQPPTTTIGRNENSNDRCGLDFTKEILAINAIMKRCTYLLCHPDLRMQVLCCETVLSGFKSLGRIGAHRKLLCGEFTSNPLLPAIAEHWPSILARLKSTSSQLHSKKTMSWSELSIRRMMAKDQDESRSDASLIVLLSKLLEIVAELCFISDGFFADRFESDVFPILASSLGDSIPAEMNNLAGNGLQSSSFWESRTIVLDPILQCLKSAFQSCCKDALAGLISSIGTILLPLLSCESALGDGVVDVLKTLMEVDCDILWRGIQKLSGAPFPSYPLGRLGDLNGEPDVGSTVVCCIKPLLKLKTDCSEMIMAQRAQDLLEFIRKLPEQDIH